MQPVVKVEAKPGSVAFWLSGYEQQVHPLAPQVDHHIMDNAGHFLRLEQPEVFNELLAAFLRKQGLLKS